MAFAEGVRDTSNSRYEDNSIDRFCEGLLILHGRTDEAYRKYGLRATRGTTNLAIYRALARQYPDLDRRQILLDLIESRGDKGKWFAAAKDEGFLDIALECAGTHGADPSTLVRAARDFGEVEPRFAASVALMAIRQLLGGGGYNPPLSDAERAIAYLFAAAQRIGATGWARQEMARLGESLAVLGANCSRIRCGRHCSATIELAPPADQRQPFRTGTELPAFLQDFANVPCSPRGRG